MNHDVTTLGGLYGIANEICQRHWGVNYTGTVELVNRDWKRRGACYSPSAKQIRMSRPMNKRLNRDLVIGCLTHELVHWRLHTTGQPYCDTDETFVAECLRVGAPISRTGIAQRVYERYTFKREYEERTGKKFDEEAS